MLKGSIVEGDYCPIFRWKRFCGCRVSFGFSGRNGARQVHVGHDSEGTIGIKWCFLTATKDSRFQQHMIIIAKACKVDAGF